MWSVTGFCAGYPFQIAPVPGVPPFCLLVTAVGKVSGAVCSQETCTPERLWEGALSRRRFWEAAQLGRDSTGPWVSMDSGSTMASLSRG